MMNKGSLPVDLYKPPVTAPAAMLPNVSCLPRRASIDELIPLYTSAANGSGKENNKSGETCEQLGRHT